MLAACIFDLFARCSGVHPTSFLCTAQKPEQKKSRREAVGALAVVASVLAATPAHAFLGIGEGEAENDTYIEDTVSLFCSCVFFGDERPLMPADP